MLHNPDLAAVAAAHRAARHPGRPTPTTSTTPSPAALATPGPVLLDVRHQPRRDRRARRSQALEQALGLRDRQGQGAHRQRLSLRPAGSCPPHDPAPAFWSEPWGAQPPLGCQVLKASNELLRLTRGTCSPATSRGTPRQGREGQDVKNVRRTGARTSSAGPCPCPERIWNERVRNRGRDRLRGLDGPPGARSAGQGQRAGRDLGQPVHRHHAAVAQRDVVRQRVRDRQHARPVRAGLDHVDHLRRRPGGPQEQGRRLLPVPRRCQPAQLVRQLRRSARLRPCTAARRPPAGGCPPRPRPPRGPGPPRRSARTRTPRRRPPTRRPPGPPPHARPRRRRRRSCRRARAGRTGTP